jgi:hypothetical protein
MKTKVNTKKKVSTKPKSKALKQVAVSGSAYVRYRYSGKSSSKFWDIVGSISNECDRRELYALGVALQNFEDFVLKQLKHVNNDFVRGK